MATLGPRHPLCFLSPQYWNFSPYLAFCLSSWPQSQVLILTRQAFYQLPACCFFLSLCSYGQVFAEHCCLTKLSYFDKSIDIMLYERKRVLPKQSLLTSGPMSTILRRNTFISVCGKRTVRPSGVEFCPCFPLRVLFGVVFLPVASGSWAADCLCQHWIHASYASLHTTVRSGYLFIHEKNRRAIFRAPRRVKEHFMTSVYVL